jgi:hypothetical protein
MVYKPSLGRAVRTCVNRGGKRKSGAGAQHASNLVYGPLRRSGLLGLDGFLGFL